MNKQYQSKKKRRFNQAEEIDDDEQIERTLNFFDAIIDQYLNEENDHVTTSSSSSSSSSLPQARRFTSENNLNKIPESSSKLKLVRAQPVRTTATSTEDLSKIPPEKRLSDLIKKTNELSANGVSASLIDLSSIDKLSSRPRFRFVPPSNSNHTLAEELELIEHQFHLKTIPTNHKSSDYPLKSSHTIVKPVVIIPSTPKSAPINRLAETNIHHENGNSAFKTHRSSKTGVSSKIEQIKRTESIQKPHVNIGLTNPDLTPRQKSKPQFHQSMVNLSSPEAIPASRYAPRTSFESNKINARYPTRPPTYDDPIARRIQQVNNTSSITGLVHPEHRSQLPYGSYISSSTGISSQMNAPRQPIYYNPQKYNSFQHPIPVQSVYQASPAVARNVIFTPSSSFNVYNFNHNPSSRNGQSKRNPHRQNLTMTTYL